MGKTRKLKVLVADAESLVRRGLAEEISLHPKLVLCAETDSFGRAGVLCERHRPEVVVLDPSQAAGVQFIADLPRWSDGTRVVALSASEEAGLLMDALRAGAYCYVSKRDSTEAVMQAIVAATEGEQFLGPRAQKVLLGVFGRGTLAPRAGDASQLSKREREVFRLMGLGRNARAIAEELHVSIKTIETHRLRMREKLGVATSAELFQRAVLAQGRDSDAPSAVE